MKQKMKDIFWLPSTVLFLLGVVDVIRGIMHTFLLSWAGVNIAKFPVTAPQDQFFMLGTFGISNFLTGALFLIISRKARELSPYVLIIIPPIYVLGLVGIWSSNIHGTADYEGKYFMLVYFGVCVITFITFLVQKIRPQESLQKR